MAAKVKKPVQPFALIPKILHIIWVGDESKRPDRLIATWREHHPSWELRIWGNAELNGQPWRARKQIEQFRKRGHWSGVADLMRYEILYRHGGVYVDADAQCIHALDDWLLETRLFAAWESERHRPGLIANTFIGAIPQHHALRDLVEVTSRMNRPVRRWSWRHMRKIDIFAWKSVGPVLFTKIVRPYCPLDATILPSVLFFPGHYMDAEPERQSSLVYARHEWGTTRNKY